MNRRFFLQQLACGSMFVAGCRTSRQCQHPTGSEVVDTGLAPRTGGRLLIQVDSQHFIDEAIWLAEHLRANLLHNSNLVIEPIIVGLPPDCPQPGYAIPQAIHVPSDGPPIDLLKPVPVSPDADAEPLPPPPPLQPVSHTEEQPEPSLYSVNGTRLRIIIDDFHSYLPMRAAVTLLFEAADSGYRYNTFQNTWAAPTDTAAIANSSRELTRNLVRPAPELESDFNSVHANSPRNFLKSVANDLVPTVINNVQP